MMAKISKPEIPKAPRREILHFNWGNTDQIVGVIMSVANKERLYKQVEKFSENFRAQPGVERKALGDLWAYVRNNVPYVPDPVGIQQIKHPARTWEDAERGEGSDCKSMSIFIRFCLYNMGIPHVLRFASYVKSKRIQHVYVVAMIDGQEVPIDTVYEKFGQEVDYTWKTDKKPERMTKIVEIAGIPANTRLPERPWFPIASMTDGELALAAAVRELELVAAINEGRGMFAQAEQQKKALEQLSNILQKGLHRADIKKANGTLQAQLYKLQRRDYASYEAFSKTNAGIQIAGDFTPTAEQRSYCDTWSQNQAQAIMNYGQGLPEGINLPYPYNESELVAALKDHCLDEKKMENVVNTHLIDSGVNFLYDQMGTDANYNSTITTKLLNQRSWIYEAARVTGLSEANVRAIARTGTIEQISETPESAKAILYPAMTKDNIGFDPFTIAALISAIVGLIGAGVQLIRQFQQQSQFQQAFRDIPDPGSPVFKIMEGDFAMPVDNSGTPTIPPGGEQPGGGQNSNLLTLGFLGAGAYLFFK